MPDAAAQFARPVGDRAGRGARARRHQARRPAGARASPACPRWRRRRCGSGCRRPSPTARRCWPMSRATPPAHDVRADRGHRRRAAGHHHDPAARAGCPGPGHMGLSAAPEILARIARRRHDHRVRQHPRPGRAAVPGAVEAERRHPADRHPSRQPGARAAPPGGAGDGRGAAARRGGDLLARSRHRLGRGGPGAAGRRAQRASAGCCSASAAPTTAWTSPAAPCWCRPTGSRCWNARPPSRAWRRASWTAMRRGRAGWTCWRSTCWAWPAPAPFHPDALYAEVRRAAPYAALSAPGFRRRAGLRGNRRLRAGGL